MKEPDSELWTQLFQDKPIPSVSLDTFQTQLMAEIVAHPVNFREEIRLTVRRKWGLGLAISLLVMGIAFGAFLWFKSTLVFQGLNVLLIMLSGLPHIVDLEQVGRWILKNMLLFSELKTGLGLLWGVVSGPILGVLSVFVIVWSFNPVRKHSI